MHGRRSLYKGDLSDNSKWAHNNDKDKVSDEMCMTNKDKTSKTHFETYNRYDTLTNENSSVGEPHTLEEKRNPFYQPNPQKEEEFRAGLEVERIKRQHEYDQGMERNQNEPIDNVVPKENYEFMTKELSAQLEYERPKMERSKVEYEQSLQVIKELQDLKLQKAQFDAQIANLPKYIPPDRQGNNNAGPSNPPQKPFGNQYKSSNPPPRNPSQHPNAQPPTGQ